MKSRFIAFSSLLLCVFTLFSCGGTKEDEYKDKIIFDSPNFIVKTDDTFKKEYDVSKQGATFDITGLSVYYQNESTPISYCEDETNIVPGKYFITLSKTTPTLSWLKKNSKMQTGKTSYNLDIYIAMITENKEQLYISKPITITLINKNVINPVLYYVGGAVIIVAVAVLGFVAKKYKETH